MNVQDERDEVSGGTGVERSRAQRFQEPTNGWLKKVTQAYKTSGRGRRTPSAKKWAFRGLLTGEEDQSLRPAWLHPAAAVFTCPAHPMEPRIDRSRAHPR
jgi:hypothetical protein